MYMYGWVLHCSPESITTLLISYQFSSVIQSCPTLCDPVDCSTPGFPVHHQLPEFTQIHVHQVGDAIQPSHPLSSPSLSALILSQHQGLFQWVSSSHQVAKVCSSSFSISPEYSLEGLMLKWKPILWPLDAKNWFIGKDPDAGKDWRWEEKGKTED